MRYAGYNTAPVEPPTGRHREEKLFSLAMIGSVIVHALLVIGIMNFPLGLGQMDTALFAEAEPTKLEAVEVFRSTNDLIEDNTAGGTEVDPTLGDRTATAGAIGEDSRKTLDAIKPDELKLPAPPREPRERAANPDVASPSPAAPKATHVKPAAAHTLDLTQKLLAIANPEVALPRYVGPSDTVIAPNPNENAIDPSTRISQAQLNKLLAKLDGGSGGGLAAGVLPGGSASVADLFDDGAVNLRTAPPRPAPPALPRPVAPKPTITESSKPVTPIPPLPKLPDLPPAVTAPTPEKPDEKPPIHLDDDFEYSLHVCRELPRSRGLFGGSSRKDPNEPDWFEVRITPKRTLRRLKHLHKDVVFVIDTSSSITDAWVNRVKSGVGLALESLNPGDRFNIVMFKETIDVLSTDGLLDASPTNADKAKQFLKAAESSGYTDVNRALGRLIVRSTPPDRVYQIIMISDGKPTRGTIDPRSIINLITRENDLVASIYCVAVGDTIDQQLLDFLAYRNKGNVIRPADVGQAESAIQQLAGELRYPLVKQATFDAIGIDTDAVFPSIPRDIYQGQTLSLYGRCKSTDDNLSMRLMGISGDDKLDLTLTLNFATADVQDGELAKRWAFWKLHHLYSEIIRQGETPELKKQIDDIRKRYKIETTY
ncbi:MAG: VWA domain-containing protein [Phycisphaera sp.]|nr:VWA domain-containing protein [Phycisphaera sp.]